MIARVANVGGLEALEKLPAGRAFFLGLSNLLVVSVARGERLLKDRWIGRHARERVVTDAPVELSVVQHSAVDAVEPDGLAYVVQLLQPVLSHSCSPSPILTIRALARLSLSARRNNCSRSGPWANPG